MRFGKLTLLIAAILPAAACTPMQWVRSDAGPAQLAQDSNQCRNEAMREAFRRTWFAPWVYGPPMIVRDARGRPFTVWPWPDPFYDRFMEEARLADFCMRAKGYELRPVEPKK